MIVSQGKIDKYYHNPKQQISNLSAACWMGVCVPWGLSSLDELIMKIKGVINILTGASALLAVALIVYAGYGFIMSNGDPEKIAKASGGITNAIIGLVIVFISRMIIFFIVDVIL